MAIGRKVLGLQEQLVGPAFHLLELPRGIARDGYGVLAVGRTIHGLVAGNLPWLFIRQVNDQVAFGDDGLNLVGNDIERSLELLAGEHETRRVGDAYLLPVSGFAGVHVIGKS